MIKKCKQFLASHPRLRVVVFIIAIIIIFIVGVDFFGASPSSAKKPNSAIGASTVDNGGAATALNTPSSEETKNYNSLQKQTAENKLHTAEHSGASYFNQNFFHKIKTMAPKEMPSENQAENPVQFYKQTHPNARINEEDQLPVKPLGSENPTTINGYGISASAEQMATALNTINKNSLPKLVTVAAKKVKVSKTDQKTNQADGQGPVIIKAGDIMFAVLDTALNSDQAGTPVMATMVTGKYKGAKLLGSFAREKYKLVIQFNQMSIKNVPHTISINAYAIDGNTAQNALSTSVNHHYLLRYGSLFAAAFLQGFGDAFNTQGSYTNACVAGATCPIQQQAAPTTEHAIYQGLGSVGTNLGSMMSQEFDTPPTVKVSQGTGMGILFMSDVSLNGSPTDNSKTPWIAPSKPGGIPAANSAPNHWTLPSRYYHQYGGRSRYYPSNNSAPAAPASNNPNYR